MWFERKSQSPVDSVLVMNRGIKSINYPTRRSKSLLRIRGRGVYVLLGRQRFLLRRCISTMCSPRIMLKIYRFDMLVWGRRIVLKQGIEDGSQRGYIGFINLRRWNCLHGHGKNKVIRCYRRYYNCNGILSILWDYMHGYWICHHMSWETQRIASTILKHGCMEDKHGGRSPRRRIVPIISLDG